MQRIFLSATTVLIAALFFYSCQKSIEQTSPKEGENVLSSNGNKFGQSGKVGVSNVEQLYEAINNPDNEGATIVIAAGTYMLNANYPKSGRLELQHNMSLVGQPGRADAVIIDATQLPLTSFTIAPTNSRTGVVRMGDGANSIEWITFQNDLAHTIRSLIQTDIISTPVAQIRIAHCVLKGSSIGISIVNREAAANGRIIEAEVEDNEIMNNTIPQFGSGIQVQNSMGVNDAVIRLNIQRNYIHDNRAGILAFNASSKRSIIEIKSNTDNIESNGLGLMFNGGFIENANNAALDNSLTFEAYGTTVKNNAGNPAPPFAFPAGGVHAAGGQAMQPFALPGTAHNNKLEISLHGCRIEDNSGHYQVNVYGGHSFHPVVTPVGTYNSTALHLYGLSKNANVQAIASLPSEAAGTNTVQVFR